MGSVGSVAVKAPKRMEAPTLSFWERMQIRRLDNTAKRGNLAALPYLNKWAKILSIGVDNNSEKVWKHAANLAARAGRLDVVWDLCDMHIAPTGAMGIWTLKRESDRYAERGIYVWYPWKLEHVMSLFSKAREADFRKTAKVGNREALDALMNATEPLQEYAKRIMMHGHGVETF